MLLLTLLVMVGGTVLCAVAAGHAWRRALGEESSQVQRQLQLYGQGLQQRIDRFGTLPQVLALDPDLLHALRAASPTEQQRLNLKLQRANEVTRASTLTLVGHDGVAVAASTGTSRPATSARTTATAPTTGRHWRRAAAASTASA